MIASGSPIGVFDSGLGGLTVVREILHYLPQERILYVGDTAHVPYGGRARDEIRGFSLAISDWLVNARKCRMIVVACNTATAAGVDALRSTFQIPIVGMEPGVKPAVAATRTGRVAVLATMSLLAADRFSSLCEQFANGVEVITQPCPGLVECVERGDLAGPETRALVERYVAPLIARGVDTLVLGCTHYPLLRPLIAEVAGPGVTLIDTGDAVARQVARLAHWRHDDDDAAVHAANGDKQPGHSHALFLPCVHAFTTGEDASAFGRLAQSFLGDAAGICPARLRWREGELRDADTAD